MSVEFKEDHKNKRVNIKFGKLDQITKQSIRRAFFDLGRDLKHTANKEILRKPKGGRTYILRTRSGRRRRHVASAPGETHANLTGKLRRSLSWQVRGGQELEFGYGVGVPTTEYGKFLENGTKRIKARPSLGNAVREVDRNAEIYFSRRFEQAMK